MAMQTGTLSTSHIEASALRALPAPGGTVAFRVSTSTAAFAHRYRELQLRLLRGQLDFDSGLQELAASLAAFDGVATRQDWVLALVATCGAYRWGDAVAIEWMRADGRLDRRVLSPMSRRLLKAVPDSLTRSVAEQIVRQTSHRLYPGAHDPIGALLGCAQAWLFDALPPALSAHALGINPMCALSRASLARDKSGLVLATEELDMDSRGTDALGCAIDASLGDNARKGSSWLVDSLVTATRIDRRIAAHIDRTRMLDRCMHLATLTADADVISAMILAWVIDLIDSGTERQHSLRPATIDKYVRLGAPAIRATFLGESIVDMEAKAFGERYRIAIEAASAGERSNLASALATWHRFLVRWFDAPLLDRGMHEAMDPPPHAEVIWPHEQERIVRWLEDAHIDDRLLGQIRVAFAIGMNARIRIGELMTLRLRSVRSIENGVEVEICPMLRDPRLKSRSAQRVLTITDPQALEFVEQWAKRRRDECAVGEDLLFGDPHRPQQVYSRGRMLVALQQLVKAATGNPEASWHTLSHAWISARVCETLGCDDLKSANPLEQIASHAGHRSAQTSLTHYAHRFETPLRAALDHALEAYPITSADAERLSGLCAATLRRRTAVRGVPRASVYWAAIRGMTDTNVLPGLRDGIALRESVRPSWLDTPPVAGVMTTVVLCADLANGRSLAEVALRVSQPESHLVQVAARVVEVVRESSMTTPRRPRTQECITGELPRIQAQHVLGVDFGRIGQPKFATLRAWLASRKASDRMLRQAIDAWQRCWRGRYLALEDQDDVLALSAMLSAARVPIDQLAVSVAVADPDAPSAAELARGAQMADAIACHYPRTPRVGVRQARRGRPRCYLTWDSRPIHDDRVPSEAGSSVTGFNALMLGAAAFVALGT